MDRKKNTLKGRLTDNRLVRSAAVALLFPLTMGVNAQTITLNKNIVTDRMTPLKINLGTTTEVFGQTQSSAAIYLRDNGDNFTAQWLSVVPPASFDRWKPYLQVPTATSILVSWKTSSVSTPSVEFGTSADALTQTVQGNYETITTNYFFNKVALTGLTPDTKYYYRIAGDSQIYSFRTQPVDGSTRKYRVLMLGDHQIIDRSGYTWLINAARQTVQQKYGTSLEEAIDVVLNPGDQVDRGTPDYYERCHFFKSSDLSTGLPIMTTVGNHEFIDDPQLNNYQKFFSYENISYQGITSGTDVYYAFRSGRTLFVVLCTETAYTSTPTQLNWLKSVLAAAEEDASVDFVVSMCHRPMNSETYITDYSAWLRDTAVPVLGSCRKHVLNIAAHHHYYQRGQVIDYPFHHIISGGASWDQTWGDAPNRFDDNLTQKTFDYWTYQIFEFDPATKKMSVECYSIGNKNIVHNNILVDRFERDLTAQGKPSKPTLAPVENRLNLPATLTSSAFEAGTGSAFNSCQFQVSTSSSFTSTMINKVYHVDNYFGDSGAPNYLPINTQEGKSCFELPIKATDLTTGRYFARVRHRNLDMTWSDWSEAIQFSVETAEKTAITMAGTLFGNAAGGAIPISFTNSPVGTSAWIGIYARGVVPGGSTASAKYAYTKNFSSGNEANGTINFFNTPVGKYFAVLFGDGGYNQISNQIEFEVVNRQTIAVVKTDKALYAEGEAVTVNYTSGPGNAKDWIGLYRLEKKVGPDPAAIYKYVATGSLSEGSLVFQDATKMKPGNYYVAYLVNDSYQECASRVYFTIGVDGPKVNVTQPSFTSDQSVELHIQGMAAFPVSWLVVKNATGGAEVKRLYLSSSFSECFKYLKLPAGEYTAEIQHFAVNQAASESVSFTVVESSAVASISEGRITVYPNPVGDQLFVNHLTPGARVEVLSLTGGLLINKIVEGGQIDLSSLSVGEYILRLTDRQGVYVSKLMKR